MSIFAKAVRTCLFIAAVCGASAFADERPNASSLAVYVEGGVSAGDQVAVGNKWDDRALPQLASLMVSAPDRDQESDTADSQSVWQWAMTAMLSETSAKWA